MTTALATHTAISETALNLTLPARRPMPEVQLPEVGRLRLGSPMEPILDNGKPRLRNGKPIMKMGRPLDFFRATSPIREDLEELAEVYGDPQQIQPWQSPDGPQWQTVLTSPVLPIALPPYTDTLVGPRYETYNASHYMTRQCDGRDCWIAVAPKRDAQGKVTEPGRWKAERCVCDPENPECAQVTRLKVVVLGIPAHGVWRVECHGKYAAAHWPAQVRMAQDLASDGHPVPATIRIESKTGRSAVFGKSLYKVPVLRLEEAFVLLPGSAQVPQIEAPKEEPVKPTTPPPSEDVPPEGDVIDGEATTITGSEPGEEGGPSAPAGESPTRDAAASSPAGATWRDISYADAHANKAQYFRELSTFQKELGRRPKPDGFEDLSLGEIVDKAGE